MPKMLSKEEVLHVAELAKIRLTDDEIDKFRVELKELLDSVEKIKDIKGYDDDILIAPTSRDCEYRTDIDTHMIDSKDALRNVPHKSGNFIEVPVVINE